MNPNINPNTTTTQAHHSLPQENPSSDERNEAVRKKMCAGCQQENPRALTCGRCRLIYYCDKECQTAHWSFHKTICKKPEITTLTCTTSNLDGNKQTKQIQMKVHLQADTEQPHSKPAGVVGLKSSAFQGLDGHFMQLRNDKDVVVFCGSYLIKETVPKLKEEGYPGLTALQDNELEDLLTSQKYIEILKHIWVEEDLSFKLNWLKTQAAKGHVILMFETARALCELTDLTEETILEAYKWRTLGRIHAMLDSACHQDLSLQAVSEALKECYPLDHLVMKHVPKDEMQAFSLKIDAQNRIILAIRLEKTAPSPKWMMYHGLRSYFGENTLAPPDQWLTLRSQKLQQMITEFTAD